MVTKVSDKTATSVVDTNAKDMKMRNLNNNATFEQLHALQNKMKANVTKPMKPGLGGWNSTPPRM